MKNSIKKLFGVFNKVIRLTVVLFVVVLLENGSTISEFSVENENLNRTLDLTSMSEKVKIENAYLNSILAVNDETPTAPQTVNDYVPVNNNDLYQPLDTFTGSLTGYSQYCAGCGGYLPGLKINIRETNTITYQDKDYGLVRIVAASTDLPFGTIIKFNLPSVSATPIVAVVADRGGAIKGTKLDLLTESEEYALTYVGRKTVTYDILRFGWER